ncbi:unnamed protein product [Linum trigynum]|uniref:Uncharacterized protein n=1 Tax=Linum trigynum TaxID=586398 RepID=A0AAV2GK28_9ROSI
MLSVIPHEQGREVEEAIGVQAEDEVEVEEACTGHELHLISPPNVEELLSNDPFAVSLCHTKVTSTSVPLGGHDGGQSMLSYLVWAMRREKRRRGLEGGDFIRIKCTSFHHLSYHMLVT